MDDAVQNDHGIRGIDVLPGGAVKVKFLDVPPEASSGG